MYKSELHSNLDNFVAAWTNRRMTFFSNGSWMGECVQIVNQYNQDVIHAPFMTTPISMSALDWFNYWDNSQKPNYYDRIVNNPNDANQIPQKGDIVVFSYVHIVIVLNADVNGFDAFEQNNPLGSACHIVHHRYSTKVLGWLRPKVQPDPPAPTPEPVAISTPAGFETIEPKKLVVTKDNAAIWNLNATSWPEFTAVGHRALGEQFTAVQIYHHPLGGKYYITATNEMNGMNIVDVADAPIEVPVPAVVVASVPEQPTPTEEVKTPAVNEDPTTIDVKVLTPDSWKESRGDINEIYIAKQDYEVTDLAGLGRKLSLVKGMRVTATATFTKDGVVYVQRQKDAEATDGTWYGVPLSILSSVSTNPAPNDTAAKIEESKFDADLAAASKAILDEVKVLKENTHKTLRQKIVVVAGWLTGWFIKKNKKEQN